MQYLVRWTTQNTVHFIPLAIPAPDRPVHSDTNPASLESIQSCCNYCEKTITNQSHFHHYLLPGIHLSELGHHEDNENAQYSKWQQRGFKPGVTVCACMRFAGVIRSGYLVLANQHTSSEGQGSRDLRQTRVEPY